MRAFWMTYKSPQSSTDTTAWPDDSMNNLQDEFNRSSTGASVWWKCKSHRYASIGATVYLFKQGRGTRGIFGRGKIIQGANYRTDPCDSTKECFQVRINISNLVDPRKNQFLLTFDEICSELGGDSKIKVYSASQSSGIVIKDKDIIDTLDRLIPL